MSIELRFEQVIPIARVLAWQSFHEDIEHLVPWLPNIEHIRVLDQYPMDAGQSCLEHAWGLDQAVVPAVAKPFIGDILKELRSSTVWHHDHHHVDFRFFLDTMRELVECDGSFVLEADGEHTRITITARLDVYPHLLPGVPRLVARSVQPAVKRVLEETISPTLEALPDALTRLVRRREPAAVTG